LLQRLPNPHGKVELPDMLRDLARREVNELHVEAGHLPNGSLLREGLVDALLVYLAPRLLCLGAGLAALPALEQIPDGAELRFVQAAPVGEALRLLARFRMAEQSCSLAEVR